MNERKLARNSNVAPRQTEITRSCVRASDRSIIARSLVSCLSYETCRNWQVKIGLGAGLCHPSSGHGIGGSYRRANTSYSRSRYSSTATRTSWLRVRTPILLNNCWNTCLTALSPIPSLAAISLFDNP